MQQMVIILLSLTGVCAQNWTVSYPQSEVCAVRGFNATIPCNYSYPQSNTKSKVVRMLWCSLNNNSDVCMNPPYVYDSNSSTTFDFVYSGNNKSSCTLLIRNVQSSYSGEYRFRFITNVAGGLWTGVPGVTLKVGDLKVTLNRISGNGNIKQGDSLNLTCDMNCTHSSSQFVWSKDSKKLNQSGSTLYFPNLTVEHSGNYTCTWKSNENSGFNSISINVEAVTGSAEENLIVSKSAPVWVIAVVLVLVVGLILIGLVVLAVISNRRRNVETPEQKSRQSGTGIQAGETNCPQLSQIPQNNEKDLHFEREVAYASLCIKPNKSTKENIVTEEKKEDVFVIYSSMKTK